jgi:nucleoside 2-deoxyribosyltransferase
MKIYLAGPLFSTAELAFNRELAGLLRAQGHEVFLPQEHEPRKDLPKAIFEIDLGGLDLADAVVACLDGSDPDSGTCWELGYAYAKGKLSLVYRTDFRLFKGSDPINLMMTESADHVIIMPRAKVADLAAEIGRLLDEESNETDK